MKEEKKRALAQLQKELKELQKDPLATLGVTVGLVKNDYFHWQITMLGPQDTPYAGGLFFLTADFPNNYPKIGPEIRFKNKIYHLNVNEANGHVCISTLNDWQKENTMSEVLSLIFALFYKENPESAYDKTKAHLFINNRAKFDENVRDWTRKYASLDETEE